MRSFPNGEKYEGFFHEGYMEGKGTWFYIDKSKLEAVWKKGKKDGKARKTLPNGDVYEITYKNGEKGEIKKIEE